MKHASVLLLMVPLLLLAPSHPASAQYEEIGGLESLDPAFDRLVPPDSRIELLETGFAWSEGPAWRKDGGYLLFSDAPNNVMHSWSEEDGLGIYLRPAGWVWGDPPGREHGSNGLIFDADGNLVFADHGNRQVVRLDEEYFTKVTLADNYQGNRFHSPNDLIIHSSGDIYFTDPPYGLIGGHDSPLTEMDFAGVYRVSTEGEVTLLTDELRFPNGIAFSPDERTLYVTNTASPRTIMAYDVLDDGTIDNGRVFFDPNPLSGPGAPDGLAIDQEGNVFVTGPGGILVLSPEGDHLGTILTDRGSANVTFGDDGSTLYITSGPNLLRMRVNTTGLGF